MHYVVPIKVLVRIILLLLFFKNYPLYPANVFIYLDHYQQDLKPLQKERSHKASSIAKSAD